MTQIIRYSSVLSSLMLGAVLSACGEKDAAAKGTEAKPVATMNVGPENIAVVGREMVSSGPALSGSLAAEREATIRAEISGPVLSTHADQGSRVARGAVLARLDDRTLRDAFLSARGGANIAQSTLNQAQRELDRFTKLKEAGAISDREFEAVRLNHEAAESQVADARARLTLAQKQLDDAQVRAPFSGIISVRSINAGDVASPGGALFTIVDPSSMRLEGAVPAAQLASVRVGAPVSFRVSGYPDRAFVGTITRVSPEADATTGQIKVVVSIPNARGGLVGGLFAEGRVAAEKREGLTAPATAIDQRGLRPTILRLKGGRAERIEVQLGLKDEETERVEIAQGVAVGDTLLIGAAQGISAGTPVKVSTPSDARTASSAVPAKN